MSTNCIFCKIITGDSPAQIEYQDDEIIIFKDIKPASKFHFLSVPKKHIPNVNDLTKNDKPLLEKLILSVKTILEEKGVDLEDIRLGFHCPPFNSVSHLHLHAIGPVTEMSYVGQMVFKPHSMWFITADQVFEKMENNTSRCILM